MQSGFVPPAVLSGLQEFELANNTLVVLCCHGPPLHFANIPTRELCYITNELDDLVGGTDTVIVVVIWCHLVSRLR